MCLSIPRILSQKVVFIKWHSSITPLLPLWSVDNITQLFQYFTEVNIPQIPCQCHCPWLMHSSPVKILLPHGAKAPIKLKYPLQSLLFLSIFTPRASCSSLLLPDTVHPGISSTSNDPFSDFSQCPCDSNFSFNTDFSVGISFPSSFLASSLK